MQAQNIFSTKIDAPIASWNCRDLHGNKHVPPPLGHNDNAGEVIVERSDVRSLLGHLRAFKSHREAHVRIPQSGGAVGSIASHCYDLPVWEDFYIP